MPRLPIAGRLTVTLFLAGACAVLPAAAAAPGGLPSSNVAWLTASADADIERAFGQARAQKKPVLLYWGATWCPPCNQLKATLFNRQEFAAQSKHFVAVFVDGDRPAAQKLGARFKVSGYPTLVLFTPEGAEITRLPGEADAPQVLSLLEAGLAGGRPIAAVLADARAGKPIGANEWRMLSFHSWAVDDSGLVPVAERPAVLAELAAKAPPGDGETTTRLWLKALAASDDGKGLKPDEALRQRVQRVLADPAASRTHMDVLIGSATDMVKALTGDDSTERAPLVAQFEAALLRLQNDATLSRGDRLGALYERVSLARLGQPKDATSPKLPEALVREVRETAARLDREITDGYERQAVITGAGSLLGYAGLWSESESLLKSNLGKSHSPYYLMSQLGSNARKLGRKDEALDWFRKAYEASEGPATRLQWGASYLSALVDLAPAQAARIEQTATRIFSEAAKDKGALHERSARSLQRVGKKLASWNADGKQAAAIKRIQSSVQALCGKVGAAEREACQALLPAAPAKG
ncbi:MAG TPA: thioredoxin family protein [Burkholderiaceae bacterium]|nr:thioredoxin family protein [Burkholderiaceae bacterium]